MLGALGRVPERSEQAPAYTALVRRRAATTNRSPTSLGERPFYDITLRVTPAVLDAAPRDRAPRRGGAGLGRHPPGHRCALVDVGTGSGAIAIVLARHLPQAKSPPSISPLTALAVARDNAARLGLEERIAFRQVRPADGCATAPLTSSSPTCPMSTAHELPTLQASVAQYEPRLALDGGPGGSSLIERLIAQLPERLARAGLALLECDPRQFEAAQSLAPALARRATLTVIPDLAGRDRVGC